MLRASLLAVAWSWSARPVQRAPVRRRAKEVDETISDFCKFQNKFWASLVLPGVKEAVAMQPGGTAGRDAVSILTAAPETPGIPRPVWLVILGSVPTLLGWYGYYKFSVEEELFQWELRTHPKGYVTGCGGYGTLFPFVFGLIVGAPLAFLHIPPGEQIVSLASAWILLGQINLYRRVNELLPEPPLWEWWALLPPPLDVVVGLRQVHFLAEYWRAERGEDSQKDVVAEDLFPFIARMPRFTLKEFIRTPSMWFWFSREWDDLDIPVLRD